MITYEQHPFPRVRKILRVRLDGGYIGDIIRVGDDQYQYVPNGQNKPSGIKGDIMPKLDYVKASIEAL